MSRQDGIVRKFPPTPLWNGFRGTKSFSNGLLRKVFEPERNTPEQSGRKLIPHRLAASQGDFERECPWEHTPSTIAPSTMVREIGLPDRRLGALLTDAYTICIISNGD